MERQDIDRLKVRSATDELVPLGTLVEIKDVSGPNLVQRYNMFVSVPVQGNAAPGVSSDQALDTMEALAEQNRSEEHTSELQSLMRISYAVICLQNKTNYKTQANTLY